MQCARGTLKQEHNQPSQTSQCPSHISSVRLALHPAARPVVLVLLVDVAVSAAALVLGIEPATQGSERV